MSLTVCKFGGSSVSDAGMLIRVNRIIRSDSSRRYIVLSAPGKRNAQDKKITDLFYQAYEEIQNGDISILSQIFNRYAAMRDALCPSFDLEGEFIHLRHMLSTSADYAASRGEYLCAKLFAAYMHLPFIDAKNLLFFAEDDRIDLSATKKAVQAHLAPFPSAVIPGFYGSDSSGNIKTFSRGGSDISGALLTAMLNADLYENWTDVDGLYTADPNIVPQAQRNQQVSMAQMERIAAAGAKLLHPDALSPLHGTGIDTVLKNTFAPDHRGTRISEDFKETVRCVTGRRRLYMRGDAAPDENSAPLLYAIPLSGSVEISVVRIFGMDGADVAQLRKLLNPIHIIHMQDHIQIIIPDKEYESTVRTVHRLLVES